VLTANSVPAAPFLEHESERISLSRFRVSTVMRAPRQARVRPAEGTRPALERICSGLGRLGYQASVAGVAGEEALITTPTCPLRPLVRADARLPELDRGMWAGLVATVLRGSDAAKLVCDTCSCDSDAADCEVRIRIDRLAV
jgi:hypothetical protein